jgi:hypothetical protein
MMDERETDVRSEMTAGNGGDEGEGVGKARAGQRVWQSPSLTYIGDLEDLVQGGGKRGSFIDGDPRAARKGGGG